MAQTAKKAEQARRQMSPTGRDDHSRVDGFTILEVVCVLAIVAIVATMVVPILPRGTSRMQLESFAMATAALLKADRNAAIRRRTAIATEVDAASRLVRSGATGRVVRLPTDVVFEALLASRCSDYPVGSTIRFFPSGMSCGGVIYLTRLGISFEIRANWLTGGVELVSLNHT